MMFSKLIYKRTLKPEDTDIDDTDKVETDKVETDKVDTDKVDTNKVDTDRVDTDKVDTDTVDTDKVDTWNWADHWSGMRPCTAKAGPSGTIVNRSNFVYHV